MNYSRERLEGQGLLSDYPYILPNLTTVVRSASSGLIAYYICDQYSNMTSQLRPYLCDRAINGSSDSAQVIKLRVQYHEGNKMMPFGEVQYNYALVSSLNVTMTSLLLNGPMTWHSNDSVLALVDNLNATLQAEEEEREKVSRQNENDDQLESVAATLDEEETDQSETTTTQQPPSVDTRYFISGLPIASDVSVAEAQCEQATERLSDGWSLWLLFVRKRIDGNVDFLSPWTSSCTQPYTRYNPELTVCEGT